MRMTVERDDIARFSKSSQSGHVDGHKKLRAWKMWLQDASAISMELLTPTPFEQAR